MILATLIHAVLMLSDSHSSAVVDQRLYIFGGVYTVDVVKKNVKGNMNTMRNDFWVLDTGTLLWIQTCGSVGVRSWLVSEQPLEMKASKFWGGYGLRLVWKAFL